MVRRRAIEVRSAKHGPMRLWGEGGAATGSSPSGGRSRPRRRCSRPAAPRRSGGGRPTRAGRSAPARCSPAAAGAELADLEFCQFHPTALALPGTELRRLADHRGGARRGRDACSTPPASASPTSWRRATRSPRRSSTGSRPTAPTRSGSTCAGSTPPASPTSSSRSPRPGLDPQRRAGPGRARRPLHDGRDRGRPRRPLLAARPLRRRRVLLHGPARRQPARLELAQRVLRLRRPRRRGGRLGAERRARRARLPRRGCALRPAAEDTRDARSGSAPGWCATPPASSSSPPIPIRSRGDRDAPRCARRETRGGHLRADFPGSDPGLDGRHLVIRRAPQERLERWD